MTRASKEAVEALAEAWAVIDGKLEQFMYCREDPQLERVCGHFGGYIADAQGLLRNLERRGFTLAPIEARP